MEQGPIEDAATLKRTQVKLEKRIALSNNRRAWEEICIVALGVSLLLGVAALALFSKYGKPSS